MWKSQEENVYDTVNRHLTAAVFSRIIRPILSLASCLYVSLDLFQDTTTELQITTLALSNNANQELTHHLLNKQQIYQTECTLHMKEFVRKFYPNETQTPNWAFCFSVGWNC